jgi:hypothetical protein
MPIGKFFVEMRLKRTLVIQTKTSLSNLVAVFILLPQVKYLASIVKAGEVNFSFLAV